MKSSSPTHPPGDSTTGHPRGPIIDLLCCLNKTGAIKQYLTEHNINPDNFSRCLRDYCR